ncbi:MAG: phenylacetate--CoA ligase family protein [Chitinophagaceae bacterium]|nr:phenylacetate--CoA ligase family protein [Chitinophagaceae bacterium]
MSLKQNIFNNLPDFLQSWLISIYNIKAKNRRFTGKYEYYKELHKNYRKLSLPELKKLQQERLNTFLKNALEKSEFYKKKFKGLPLPTSVEELPALPITKKEELRAAIDEVYTIPHKGALIAKTGGTTGISLQVRYTPEDIQERYAILDNFREATGYQLGKKTAWFSGKALLTKKDIEQSRFWKTDKLHNVRYYSTFHLKNEYLEHYVNDIIQFQPEYISGFPTSITEVAKYGLSKNISFQPGIVKAIFPTAETTTPEMYDIMQRFFNAKVYNQYASSEGSPFILECHKGKLHLELTSGVFEVLDDNDKEAEEGRLVVTAFNTNGTPLIRYDIGDVVEKDPMPCDCGNNNPVVKKILGRVDDFVYSPENGKINTVNMANATKGVKGLVKYQVEQKELNKIRLLMVVDEKLFDEKSMHVFIENWRDRVGRKMEIVTEIVNDIPVEKSGKYRIVKNYIKDQIRS